MTAEQTGTAPWWRRIDPCVPAWLLAATVVWGLHGFQDGISRDSALYAYAGQEIASGDPPYVGVLNRAGPLAQLLPWLGVELARLVGTGDVMGIRILFFLLLVATPALVHVLTRDVFGSRLAGSAAAVVLLAFQGLAVSVSDGPHSKQPMMLGLIVALLLLSRRRWLAAGLVTGLATLTWQPVVLVLVAAAVVTAALSPGDARSRTADLGRFVGGGALTLAATVGSFLVADALDAFVEGFWTINAGYTSQDGLVARPLRAWTGLTGWFGWTTWLLVVGCLLSLALGVVALRARPRGADRAALGAATVAGLAWSATAFNGAPDALLLLPLAAIGIGGAVALVADRLPIERRRLLTAATLGWVSVALAATAQVAWADRSDDLATAQAEAEAVFAALPADATVFAFNAPQPLALAGRSSISRYVLFGEGMKEYVASQSGGDIRGYAEQLQEARPTIVIAPSRGLTGFMRPLAPAYVEVGDGVGWRAYLRRDVDRAVREQVIADIAAVRAGQ